MNQVLPTHQIHFGVVADRFQTTHQQPRSAMKVVETAQPIQTNLHCEDKAELEGTIVARYKVLRMTKPVEATYPMSMNSALRGYLISLFRHA